MEGRSFTYEGDGVPMLALARNTWTVAPYGARTMVSSDAEVIVRGGRFGRLIEPLIRFQSRRMGRRALAAFAMLAETGRAPDVHQGFVAHPALC